MFPQMERIKQELQRKELISVPPDVHVLTNQNRAMRSTLEEVVNFFIQLNAVNLLVNY